jgi:hypothetical protein
VSLITISASIEDFQDVIKALPQTTEVDMPGWPKRFGALSIAITAMVLSSFNAYRITELNNEISALKSKNGFTGRHLTLSQSPPPSPGRKDRRD